ncbi:MAG TPA: twin-arginine translocation signal domain-containing protein [Desulfobulbus sp.]|nr:twin-arginine translocation signal domain-containing protein [Desulfobulbus sp.]
MQKIANHKNTPFEQEPEGKTGKPANQSRRKALKTLAAGTAAAGALALTSKWSKPVVDTIILPAHAQATNGAAPLATTTPAPTITMAGGGCSPQLGPTCIEIVKDQNNYITSATVKGTVTPPRAGVAIDASFRSFSQPTNASHDYLFQTTTNAAGAFSVGQTFAPAEEVTEIDAGYAGTPCGGTDIGFCGGGG